MASRSARTTLVISDFDRTLHDGDADVLVVGSAAVGAMDRATAGDFHWQVWMDDKLGEMHKEGVTWQHMREMLRASQVDPYALKALRRLKRRGCCTTICLTSGNGMFVSSMLDSAGFAGVFDHVVGQFAELKPDGRLRIQPRSPIDKPHGCQLGCYAGLCKSRTLGDVVDPDSFDRRIFLGDGRNDWCSVEALHEGDVALVRAGYALDRLISATALPLACTVLRWQDGKDLARLLDGL